MANTKGKRKPARDPYDELILQADMAGVRPAPAKKPRKKNAIDPYDELIMAGDGSAVTPSAKNRKPAINGFAESGVPGVKSRNSAAIDSAKPNEALIKKRKAARDIYDDFDAPITRKTRRAKSGGETRAAKTRGGAKGPHDDFLFAAEGGGALKRTVRGAARKNGNSRGGGKRGGGFLAFVLASLILLCAMIGGWQMFEYSRFIAMRNAVDRSTFNEGVFIEGMDVSDMTLAVALEYWKTQIEPRYSARIVQLDNGVTLKSADVGYSSNYREVLETAWSRQTSGTLADRYASLVAAHSSPARLDVERTIYTNEAISALAAEIGENTDTEPVNSAVTGFDTEKYEFTYSESSPGRVLDREKLVSDIKAAFDAGGGAVSLKYTTIEPATKSGDMQGVYGLRSSAVTNASSSSTNRLTNIKLALASINGLILKPGDEFSFNGAVGQRTSDRGYKMAAAFSGGEVTEELGGGICQVSTTLFNAAVKADLDITERHPHSMPVSYVDKGKDATVNWGSQDLKFVNTTDSPIYIAAVLTGEKRVRIGIFGLAIENGEYITVEATVTETIEFETTYHENAFLMPGEMNELQAGRKGYKAVAYKIRWSAGGEMLDKEVLCNSNYAKRDAIFEVSAQ